ncbi:aromatic acid exporter family protein [uncultured Cetobacterium sp.]|uniref:aromatic acid exporter family protein n=3 Tax=uncultured Cetobacterium sp. TaxID=527638 RepID=UPI00261F7483|nr:aromatic acid exporter family protein [uncultured Cetobacterium sp.]
MIFDKITAYDKHKVLKNMIAPYIAMLIAQHFNLGYKYSAATICILSLESTRKGSLRSSIERLLAASFGLLLSALIIKFFNFNPIALVFYTAIFMPLCIRFNLMQGFFTNIVLATHFLLQKNVDLYFVLDQYILLLVGVLCAMFANIYMPSQRSEIISYFDKIDVIMNDIVFDFSKALRYKAVSLNQNSLFETLKLELENCKNLVSMEKDNKFFYKKITIEKNYSIKVSEYICLIKMRECFEKISLDLPVTHELSLILKELSTLSSNDYVFSTFLNRTKSIEKKFKDSLSHKEKNFENEAVYFQLIESIKEYIALKKSNIY